MIAPLVLASGSPRRRELLAELGIPFEVIPADVDEAALTVADPWRTAEGLALAKARAVAERLGPLAGHVILGADTVVAYEGATDWTLLGKPADASEAGEMLRTLRGREHVVVTGVAALSANEEEVGSETSRVTLRDLTDDEIAAYVATGDPLDKAGAYAIQHPMNLVARLDGAYDNVVGLPMALVRRLLGATE